MADVYGTEGDDTLTGTAGPDGLYGLAGDDILKGGDGTDYLEGGDGDDILDGGDWADWLVGGAGIDTATYALSGLWVTVDLKNGINLGGATGEQLALIENLVGSAFDDTLVGEAGVNSLDGGNGDDLLDGQDGGDRLNGGAGNDTAYYLGSTAGVTISLATGLGLGGYAQGDTLVNVENLNGTYHDDTLTGDGGDNAGRRRWRRHAPWRGRGRCAGRRRRVGLRQLPGLHCRGDRESAEPYRHRRRRRGRHADQYREPVRVELRRPPVGRRRPQHHRRRARQRHPRRRWRRRRALGRGRQ